MFSIAGASRLGDGLAMRSTGTKDAARYCEDSDESIRGHTIDLDRPCGLAGLPRSPLVARFRSLAGPACAYAGPRAALQVRFLVCVALLGDPA
jgi:hypothetical protein